MYTFLNRYKKTVLLFIVLAIAVPFLDKPYTIDDPFVLHVAENILKNPLDPFYGEIDWHGHIQTVWEATTNPPLLSYYLALCYILVPSAVITNYSEIVLHAAMTLFLFLLAGSMLALSQRFTKGVWLPTLFVLTSCAVMVSSNVMRDVPAAGLALTGITCFILGTDCEDWRLLLAGSTLAGLAILTKYSSVITIPILLLYPFFKRRYRLMLWVLPAFVPLAVWCLHTKLVYGSVHVVYLFLERRSVAGIPWRDKLCGAFVILGMMMYLLPALLFDVVKRRNWIVMGGGIVIALAVWRFIQSYFQGSADGGYLFWGITGGVFLFIGLYEGLHRGIRYIKNMQDVEAADSLFLFAWLCAPVLFSVIFIPFQAVRHQILALPPLAILGIRYLQREPRGNIVVQRIILITFLCIQTVIGYVVHIADYAFAECHREFAEYARENWVSDDYETWYVGHWGWKFYAQNAGFRMVHRDGEFPKEGDILLKPVVVHTGDVFSKNPLFEKRLKQVDKKVYSSRLPIRTMNWNGASFYAVIDRHIPYRFFQKLDLETMYVYRVGPPIDESETRS